MPDRAAYKKQDKSHWPDFKHKPKSTQENKRITSRMTRRKKKQEVSEMGLTERHWFEDEEPELTESQLEDILWEHNRIFERGYQKGFSDGRSALFREQERVKPTKNQNLFANFLGWNCGACGFPFLSDGYTYCPRCGRKVDWNGSY